MAMRASTTTDHETIQQWVEERDGRPAKVKSTRDAEGEGGLLRIDFPGYTGQDTLEEISWDEFFEDFEENQLAFLYQDETRDGELSRFSKFIARETGAKRSQGSGKDRR